MEVLKRYPSANLQSSLRDFSSFEFLPRTASWAKFSRPCGTHFVITWALVLDGQVQDPVEPLHKDSWVLQRHTFHQQSLIEKQPRRIFSHCIVGTRQQLLDD